MIEKKVDMQDVTIRSVRNDRNWSQNEGRVGHAFPARAAQSLV